MAGNAIETAKQETGSKVYFRAYIEASKPPTESALFNAVVEVYPDLAKNVKLREIWMSTYAKQAEALKKYLGNNRGYNYSRGEKNGFMDLTIQNGTGTAGMNSYGIIPLYQPKK
jgi:hypothetical protein